jgi:hypothetical protein
MEGRNIILKPESFHKTVYDRDNPITGSYGWIQWKGTDVCIDITCECGYRGHYEGWFLYYYSCPVCGLKYALGQNIALIKLLPEEIEYVYGTEGGFKTAD